jgi:hypothetical protein
MPVASPAVMRAPAPEATGLTVTALEGAGDADDADVLTAVGEVVQRRRAPEDAAGPLVSDRTFAPEPANDAPGKGHPHDHRMASSVEREAELDDLLERLEERLLDEIDRRGGRFGGRF